MRRWLAFVFLFGCGHGGGGGALGPAIVTGVAALAEVVSYRAAQHGCNGMCGAGTECNHQSGMCEAVPCGGSCPTDMVCDGPPGEERCVDAPLAPIDVCAPLPDGGSLLLVMCTDGGAAR